MLRRTGQPSRRKTGSNGPSLDESIFGARASDEPGYADIFSSLSGAGGDSGLPPMDGPSAGISPRHPKRLSDIQKVLVLAIIAVAGLLGYTLLQRARQTVSYAQAFPSDPSSRPSRTAPEPNLRELPVEQSATLPEDYHPVRKTPQDLPSPGALSLELAERFYQRKDFDRGCAMYERLYQQLPATQPNQALRDFLLLRMALCNQNTGNASAADALFRRVSLSRMPILRALARYHQSTMLIGRQRYLEAAARAWQTEALIDVIDYDDRWTSAVHRECSHLVAEATTRHLLSLSDADGDLPSSLWTRSVDIDCFENMDEAQLRLFLTSGLEQLDDALLSPRIQEVTKDASARRWSVICNGAPVEEVIARLATHAGLNVHWPEEGQSAPAEETLRKRPVYLYLTSATAQQAIAAAAGSIGLLACMDGQGNVKVLDPSSYSSLSEHTKLLADESISLWQRFLLSGDDDARVANGHFVLGLVQTAREHLDEAIAEYKLVANRFPQHPLAPHALLHSGKLKVRLRDYTGAHEDLKQLMELYPDSSLSDQACLYVADISFKAGLYDEASGLYRKVHNLGLSVESQTQSSLGAGRCFYETGDFENAAKWLNRYLALAESQDRQEFHSACLLLGKTYLALQKPQQAQAALNLALRGDLSRQQHVETIAILVKTYAEQGMFFDALQVLESTTEWQLSQQEMIELLVLRARVFRLIGLADKAVSLLVEKGQFLPNPELKGAVALELARCYAQSGNLETAKKTLSEMFALCEPGPTAHEIGCELARVLLQLQQPEQTIPVCTQLLKHANPTGRGEVLSLLAQAHRAKKDYGRAVSVLLDPDTPDVPANGANAGPGAVIVK